MTDRAPNTRHFTISGPLPAGQLKADIEISTNDKDTTASVRGTVGSKSWTESLKITGDVLSMQFQTGDGNPTEIEIEGLHSQQSGKVSINDGSGLQTFTVDIQKLLATKNLSSSLHSGNFLDLQRKLAATTLPAAGADMQSLAEKDTEFRAAALKIKLDPNPPPYNPSRPVEALKSAPSPVLPHPELAWYCYVVFVINGLGILRIMVKSCFR